MLQVSLVRLFLAVDYAVNLVSGYSYRNGWRKKKTAAALEDKSNKSFGRIVTIFGHPLLDEQRVFLHTAEANRVVHQNLTQKAVEYSCVLIIKYLLCTL